MARRPTSVRFYLAVLDGAGVRGARVRERCFEGGLIVCLCVATQTVTRYVCKN